MKNGQLPARDSQNGNKPSDNNLHRDHRSRLRKRFLRSGIDGFEDHTLLELLLFYSIPRRDTNDIAHRLIEHFGSLGNVFDASAEELMQVEGIGEQSAVLIRLLPSMWQAYQLQKSQQRCRYGDTASVNRLLVSLFSTRTEESVYALFFDSSDRLLAAKLLFSGSVDSCIVRKRSIAEIGIRLGASFFLLAHNHPSGTPKPSMQDIRATQALIPLFRELEMPLVDHRIVCGEAVVSLLNDTDY